MTAPFVQHAQRYARQRFFVYPLAEDSRTPCRGSHAFRDATRDTAKIEAMAASNPRGNLAILTGKEADLSVIDIDLRNGGFNTLAAFERQGKLLPLDAYYTTPGGGWHVLFRYHPALKTGANRLGSGIDFVNDGAGTPVPPTTLADGRRYSWKAWPADGQLPTVPAWVLDFIEAERLAREAEIAERKPIIRTAASREPESDFERRRRIASARVALEREAQALATACKPGRNRTLFTAVCRLGRYVHAGCLDTDALTDALRDACNRNGLAQETGLRDVLATIARALNISRNDQLPELAERRCG